MPLINCKIEFSLKLNENSIFEITDTKLYVLVVTLSAEDNVKLSKLLGEGFKRSIYWNKCKVIPNKTYNAMITLENYLIPNIKSLKDYLFLLMIMLMESHLILTKDTFYQELKSKIITLKLMVEIFMIKQLMTQLSNMMK